MLGPVSPVPPATPLGAAARHAWRDAALREIFPGRRSAPQGTPAQWRPDQAVVAGPPTGRQRLSTATAGGLRCWRGRSHGRRVRETFGRSSAAGAVAGKTSLSPGGRYRPAPPQKARETPRALDAVWARGMGQVLMRVERTDWVSGLSELSGSVVSLLHCRALSITALVSGDWSTRRPNHRRGSGRPLTYSSRCSGHALPAQSKSLTEHW